MTSTVTDTSVCANTSKDSKRTVALTRRRDECRVGDGEEEMEEEEGKYEVCGEEEEECW